MHPLFFIHVPKTAGTSFRKAAEAFYSREKIVYDYGEKQPETHPALIKAIYEEKDFYQLKQLLISDDIRLLGGHVPAKRFSPLFNQQQVFSFVREPVSRLVSEFKHFKRHYDFTGDLRDFCKRPEFTNRQFRMFQGYAPHLLGFIGITEHYSESLQLFNATYGTDLQDLSLNMAGQDKAPQHDLDEELVSEIAHRNKAEVSHYQACCRLFNQRRELYSAGLSFVHGQIGSCKDGKVFGWAFDHSNQPVELAISVNDQLQGKVKAKEHRPALLQFNTPRQAFVGFTGITGQLKTGDKVQVKVADTGQELVNSPFIIQ